MPSLRAFQRENIQFCRLSPRKIKACEAAESHQNMDRTQSNNRRASLMHRKQHHTRAGLMLIPLACSEKSPFCVVIKKAATNLKHLFQLYLLYVIYLMLLERFWTPDWSLSSSALRLGPDSVALSVMRTLARLLSICRCTCPRLPRRSLILTPTQRWNLCQRSHYCLLCYQAIQTPHRRGRSSKDTLALA